jgi:hypothetical protein
MVLVVLGTMLGLMLAASWLVGKTQWDATDAQDPRKVLAVEMLATVRTRAMKFSRNGTGAESNGHRTRSWWKPEKEEPADAKNHEEK